MSNTGGAKNAASVAIVILNWNGRSYLEQFLPSVVNTVYGNKQVIVIDNDSSDDSVNFLKSNYPSVEVIRNTSNFGFAKGYNEGLKSVSADYYVLLNSDVEVDKNWIEPIVSLMESDKMIGACQPKILSYHERSMFEYAGASGGWIDHFGYPFMRGRIFDICEQDRGQYDDATPCFWASGAALFVRSALYHVLGGLDEYFFAHQEEIDFCWRLQLAGYSVFVQPASLVYHVGGGTLPKGNNRKVYLNFRNNLIMIYKNLTWKRAISTIPARILLDAVAAWKALLGGDSGYFISIGKAHFHFMKWMFFAKKTNGRKVKAVQLQGWYNGSIVWDYFIKKKKYFSEIIRVK